MATTPENPPPTPIADLPPGFRLRLRPFPLTIDDAARGATGPSGSPAASPPGTHYRSASAPAPFFSAPLPTAGSAPIGAPTPSAMVGGLPTPDSQALPAWLLPPTATGANAAPTAGLATPLPVNTPAPFPSIHPSLAPFPPSAPVTISSTGVPPPPPDGARASSPPMSVPTFTRLFKVGTAAVILLVASFFTVRTAYPFLKELIRPGSVVKGSSKDAPTSARMLQHTRGVVAKSNANVEHLDAIIATEGGAGPGSAIPSLALGIDPLPSQPALPPPAQPKPQVRLDRLSGIVLDDYHVSGVRGGDRPRIMVNGIHVTVGGFVDGPRRLQFMSLDEERRVVVFGDGDETVEKSY